MSKVGAPKPRSYHTAVWTGKEMIVWGGTDYNHYFNNGARYDPITDSWRPMTVVGAPTARGSLTAVWTGQEMIVWGGFYMVGTVYTLHNRYPADLGRYNPDRDSWITNTVAGSPTPRAECSAIWDGTEVIVWGGYNGKTYGGRTVLNTGGRFNPVSETWAPVSIEQAPAARANHLAVWIGQEMINLGRGRPVRGLQQWRLLSTGHRYLDFGRDEWRTPLDKRRGGGLDRRCYACLS